MTFVVLRKMQIIHEGRFSVPRAMICYCCLLAFLTCVCSRAMGQPQRVAVLDLGNKVNMAPSEMSYLAEVLRGVAREVLPSKSYSIMTKDNLLDLLPNQSLAECQGECAVTTGKQLGAAYVVSGEIISYLNEYRISLSLHETESANLLNSLQLPIYSPGEIELGLRELGGRLFKDLPGYKAPPKSRARLTEVPKPKPAVSKPRQAPKEGARPVNFAVIGGVGYGGYNFTESVVGLFGGFGQFVVSDRVSVEAAVTRMSLGGGLNWSTSGVTGELSVPYTNLSLMAVFGRETHDEGGRIGIGGFVGFPSDGELVLSTSNPSYPGSTTYPFLVNKNIGIAFVAGFESGTNYGKSPYLLIELRCYFGLTSAVDESEIIYYNENVKLDDLGPMIGSLNLVVGIGY